MRKNIGLYFIGSIILLIILLASAPSFRNGLYTNNYIVDVFSAFLCITLFCIGCVNKNYDLFSPISFFSLIYIMMYFITPVYDLFTQQYTWYGIEAFEYGIKGTLIALLGYIAFYFAYNRKLISESYERDEVPFHRKQQIDVSIIVLMYFVCFIANAYYLMASGKSFAYIVTLGAFGSAGGEGSTEGLGFISVLSYALPSCALLYCEYGRSRYLKIIAFVLMFVLQVARGFRFFVLQIAFMFISYYYLRNCKKPRIREMLVLIMISLIPIVIMTMFRNSIRAGTGIDLSIVSQESVLEALVNAFWGNLRIYKNYYGIVGVVPRLTGYLFGAQIVVYTMIMLIPRAIWPGKPGNPGTEAQLLSFGQAAVLGGSAYPGLGEYYYDSGIFGVVLWMSILGIWLRNTHNKYRSYARDEIDLMIYCTTIGCILQILIRGYTPSNFWMLIFAMTPYWVVHKFVKREERIG